MNEETKNAKPAMTEDEKRAKRNAYAKAYYAQHKDQIKANNKRCRDKKKTVKAAKPLHAICPESAAKKSVRPPKVAVVKKAAKPTPEQKNLKKLEKVLVKAQTAYEKAVAKVAELKAAVKTAKDDVKAAKALVKAVAKASPKA